MLPYFNLILNNNKKCNAELRFHLLRGKDIQTNMVLYEKLISLIQKKNMEVVVRLSAVASRSEWLVVRIVGLSRYKHFKLKIDAFLYQSNSTHIYKMFHHFHV